MTSSKARCGAPGLVFIGEEMQRGSPELLDNFGRRGDGGGRGGSRRRAAGAFGEESRGGRDSHGRGERAQLGLNRVFQGGRCGTKSIAAQISTVPEV